METIHNAFIKGTNGALLLFDLTANHTLDSLDYWVNFVRKKESELPIILVGTKLDLDIDLVIEDKQALEYLEPLNIVSFHKVSSKTGDGVDGLVLKIKKLLLNE